MVGITCLVIRAINWLPSQMASEGLRRCNSYIHASHYYTVARDAMSIVLIVLIPTANS